MESVGVVGSAEKVSRAEVVDVGKAPRLMSLDALRGFDMFWIIGADELVGGLAKVSQGGVLGFLAYELKHKQWEGFTFYDLIFPLFLFMVGVSIVLSLSRVTTEGGKRAAYLRIFRRFLLLWMWSFIYDGGFQQDRVSFAGVLQRISYCYLLTSILFLNLRIKGLVAVFIGILAGYWALMTFVPVPDIHRPTFEMGNNWSNYLDRNYLPGEREARGWRNEGMLSTVPAVATCLLGVFAGAYLKKRSVPEKRKAALLLATGAALVALGFLWGLQFPVIKRIWTSSYVLVAGGYSLMLLGAFYLVIDVWNWRRWATPFVWIGANSLTLYLVANIIPHGAVTDPIVGGAVREWLGAYDGIAQTVLAMGLLVVLARFMYRRGIFLRV